MCGLSLMGIRIIILVSRSQWFKISNVRKGTVACGIANLIGNKGAVGVSFNFNESRFIFINSHLAAHMNKWEERNQNYRQIVGGLKLNSSNPLNLTNYYHFVFWMGDLNYRLEADRDYVINQIKANNFEDLALYDQLSRERVWGNTFVGFSEESIQFPPTYRYHRNSTIYSEEKLRVPSWCDRILCKTLTQQNQVKITNYKSTDTILSSDHHPVSAEILVNTQKSNWPHIPKKSCKIQFSSIEIIGIESNNNNDISILFLCDSFVPNQSTISPVAKYQFNSSSYKFDDNIPPFDVITTNKDFLENECVFLIIREHSKKKEISDIGQSVIPLFLAFNEAFLFDYKIQYRGKFSGAKIKGQVYVSYEKESELGKDSYSIDLFAQKKGYLLKHRRRKWDRKFFVLTNNNCLYYYVSENVSVFFHFYFVKSHNLK